MSGSANGNGLTDSKQLLESNRFWGFVTMAVPLAIQMSGVTLTPAESAQVAVALQKAQNIALDAPIIWGIVQMVYGGWNARQPLHIFKAREVDTSGHVVAPVEPLPLTPDVAKVMDEHPVN